MFPLRSILQQLHDQVPAGPVTLQWLMGRLREQSFGMIILILAIAAAAPGVSILAGLLLLVPSFQMIIGFSELRFPRWIATRELPTRHVGAVMGRAIPILKYLERVIYPRFRDPARNDTARRRRDYICAHDSVTASAIAAQQYRPRDLHRVHFADLCRTRRFTPYPGAFVGMPFSRLRNWHNLATDPQCKHQFQVANLARRVALIACFMAGERSSPSIAGCFAVQNSLLFSIGYFAA